MGQVSRGEGSRRVLVVSAHEATTGEVIVEEQAEASSNRWLYLAGRKVGYRLSLAFRQPGQGRPQRRLRRLAKKARVVHRQLPVQRRETSNRARPHLAPHRRQMAKPPKQRPPPVVRQRLPSSLRNRQGTPRALAPSPQTKRAPALDQPNRATEVNHSPNPTLTPLPSRPRWASPFGTTP
jgi:hypothetical protein